MDLTNEQIAALIRKAVDIRVKEVIDHYAQREAVMQTQIDDLTKAVATLTKVVAKSQG